MTPSWVSPAMTRTPRRRGSRHPPSAPLVAALDDWAVCCTGANSAGLDPAGGARRRPGRLAQPRPRPSRLGGCRGPGSSCARAAPVAEQPPTVLLALGERLQLAGGDGIGFLRRCPAAVPGRLLDQLYSGSRPCTARVGKATAIGKRHPPSIRRRWIFARKQSPSITTSASSWSTWAGWKTTPMAAGDPGQFLSSGGPYASTPSSRRLATISACASNAKALGGSRFTSTGTPYGPIRSWPPRISTLAKSMPAVIGSTRRSTITERPCGSIRISSSLTTTSAIALLAKGRQDEVFEDYPADVESLNQLRGAALGDANAYYWQAYLLDPNWFAARNSLQISPQDLARLDEATDHYPAGHPARSGVVSSPRGSRPGSLSQTTVSPKRTSRFPAVSNSSRGGIETSRKCRTPAGALSSLAGPGRPYTQHRSGH